jgi:hypothetical protein
MSIPRAVPMEAIVANGLAIHSGDKSSAIVHVRLAMLKLCASICCLLGAVVIVYIVGSGGAGRAAVSAPDWIYAHY